MRDDEPTEEEAKKLQANARRSSLQVDSKMGFNNNSFAHPGGRNTRSSTVSKSPTLATITDDKPGSRYVHCILYSPPNLGSHLQNSCSCQF